MTLRALSVALLACGAACVAACGNGATSPSGGVDAASDASGDASGDASSDASSDASGDASSDATRDARADVSVSDGVADVEASDVEASDAEASDAEAGTPASLLLAFISDRAGTNDLYTVRGDGSDLRARVVGPGNEAFPVFTSDGAGIVYWSDRDGGSALYRHDLATDADTKYATDVPALDGALSPDGSTLAFESREVDGDAAIFDAIRTAPAIGGASKLLTMPGESWAAPLFLPSGEILFVRGAASGYVVATMNVDGSALTNLPLSQAPTGRVGVSATGRTIAYDASVTIDDAGDLSSRVILFDVATGSETALPANGDSAPVVARDDRTVAAVTTRYGSIDIVLMDASGALISRLTGATGPEGTNTDPAFAP